MRPVIDSIVVGVPHQLSPLVDGVLVVQRMRALVDALDKMATATLGPECVLTNAEWTIATTPAQAAEWSIPHDCDDCRDGRARAVSLLTEHPDRPVALGVLYYEEPEA